MSINRRIWNRDYTENGNLCAFSKIQQDRVLNEGGAVECAMRHVYRFVIKLLSERWPAGRGLFIRNEGGNSKWWLRDTLEFKILTIFFQKKKKLLIEQANFPLIVSTNTVLKTQEQI